MPLCLNSGWVYASQDFSNILSKTAIERLADVDEYEVVREVQVSPLLPVVPLRSPHRPCGQHHKRERRACARLLLSPGPHAFREL